MAKPIIINTVNFTSWFTRTGYTVWYEPVDGGQGGVMQNGDYTEDEIALKAVIRLTCLPLNEIQLSHILTTIYSRKYATVTYFDPKTRANRTIEARRSISEQKYAGYGPNGYEFWVGMEITFRER